MSKMKRREFLVVSGAAAVGLTCLGTNLKAALAAARLAGKPLLTEANINAFIQANPLSTPKGQQVFAGAASNLSAFATKHFYLTAEQSSELATISAGDRRKLADAIERARNEGMQLKVRIVNNVASLGTERYTEADHSMPLSKIIIHIGIEIFGKDVGVTFTKEKSDDKTK